MFLKIEEIPLKWADLNNLNNRNFLIELVLNIKLFKSKIVIVVQLKELTLLFLKTNCRQDKNDSGFLRLKKLQMMLIMIIIKLKTTII